MQQPTMFCHDGTTIYYPTGPGRVHMITIAALADCDGSDEDLSDSTTVGHLSRLIHTANCGNALNTTSVAPRSWPPVHVEKDGVITEQVDGQATVDDFHDALEQWADWCDRDAARLDSLDAIMDAVAAA